MDEIKLDNSLLKDSNIVDNNSGKMTISSALAASLPTSKMSQGDGQQTVSVLAVAPTLSQLPAEAGATVYVAVGSPAPKADSPLAWSTVIPKVQSANSARTEHLVQQPAHVVKIQINPEQDNSRVISTVRLAPDQDVQEAQEFKADSVNSGLESCVRINVLNETDHQEIQRGSTESVNTSNRSSTCFYYGPFQIPLSTMVMSSGQCSPSDTLDSGTCSDLDGTPPPLPKKKNSSTVVLGCPASAVSQHVRTGSLTSSGADVDSATDDDNESNISCDSLNGELAASAGGNLRTVSFPSGRNDDARVKQNLEATVDELERVSVTATNNDFNKQHCTEINNLKSSEKLTANLMDVISSGMQASPSISPSPSSTSSLSKSSSTPRVRSPNPFANGHGQQHQASSPVVKECTYEDRKREQRRVEEETAAAELYANYNRENGTKYVYEDDRFYKFHINELEPADGAIDDDELAKRKKCEDNDADEYFAGFKILDKEAIRSAKGTVRGVKNRVRAGIATFLQNPSSKNYKQKDAGKIVVYTTSMRVVPRTLIACMKMRQILNTNMVQYEVRDLFGSREFQTELKERLGMERIEVPQLFIDGQHMGDADAVERLNESGELRPMLKPYKYRGVRQVCAVCGGAGAILCISCHGSKKSQSRRWKGFLNETFALRCMNCDEVGLIRCPNC